MKPILLVFLLLLSAVSIVIAGPYDDLIKNAGDKKAFPGSGVLVVFDSTHVEMMESGLSHSYIHRLY